MKSARQPGNDFRASFLKRLILAGMLAVALALPNLAARAEEGELAKEDKACLKCHDKEGLVKKLGNGDKLSLHISTAAYVASMHRETSCEDCHDNIDARSHGKKATKIQGKREYSLSLRESCRTCHKNNFTEYEDSVHASLIKDGNKKAPLCSDCHDPHTVRSTKIAAPPAETPCANCHEDIFKAYSMDVHGQVRSLKGKAAPICADCHKAHAVQAASLGEGIKDACLTCHNNAVVEHQDWLPNAERHFVAISCPACHAPTAQRRVNLRLYDIVAKRQLSEKTGVPQFQKLAQAADARNEGLDERALWSLLKEFNQDDDEGRTVLQGRLEVRSGVEAHQLSDKAKAIKDCNACHQAGAEPFQSVSLTIAGPDGRPLRHGIQKEVLHSMASMESVRGFYAIGGTRIKLLDNLLVLVLLAGICGPLAHMSLKWYFKRAREERAAMMNTAIPPADSPDALP